MTKYNNWRRIGAGTLGATAVLVALPPLSRLWAASGGVTKSDKKAVTLTGSVTPERLAAETTKTRAAFETLYLAADTYRRRHRQLPSHLKLLIADLREEPRAYKGIKPSTFTPLMQTNVRVATPFQPALNFPLRPDGGRVGDPKPEGGKDILAIRFMPSVGEAAIKSEHAMVLWEDGRITDEPRRNWIKTRKPVKGGETTLKPGATLTYRMGIVGQAGTKWTEQLRGARE